MTTASAAGDARRIACPTGTTERLLVMPKQGMRGSGASLPPGRESVGLPARPFLFTLDQVAVLLDMDEKALKDRLVYFQDRSIGIQHRGLLVARNIAQPDHAPDWRVAERELVRWMKFKGFRYYERGTFF
jgi:hypothetical protein